MLFIKKGLNPVTLGLCLQAFSYLSKIYPEKVVWYKEKIELCIKKLLECQSKGYSGTCWGYNFDWESRYAKIDAYVPTIVATGIIANCLFTNYFILKNDVAASIIIDATKFVLQDLNRFYDGNNYCLSYSPVDTQKVHNASMKGARLLAQAYRLTGNAAYKDEARNIVSFTMVQQKENGSWSYAYQDARIWSDNFHTAYVLDCLQDYMKLTGDETWKDKYLQGYKYYRDSFFKGDLPNYYDNNMYPFDSTVNAQSIMTLLRNNDYSLANKIVSFSMERFFHTGGYFFYQIHRYHKHKTPYMRWSTAYMFAALSYYMYCQKLYKNPS